MAISNAVRLALKAATNLDIDIKKSYKAERRLEQLTARLKGKPTDYLIWDQEVTCEDHSIPVRLFSPKGPGPFPIILFFHGGGWVTGGIEHYTAMCLNLAKATRHMVASVDYRLAPENRFPAAPEDCYAVAREFFCGAALGVDIKDIILMGDSAGGNLAAAVSLMARDRGEFLPQQQVLLYPATYNDHSENSPYPSVVENGTDYLLTSKRVDSMMEMYRASDADLQNPYYAPLLEHNLSRQPRTLVITAEYDPLRDEGEAYGEKLRKAGCDVTIYRMKDAVHAFMMLPPNFVHVKRAYEVINTFLAGR